MRLLSRLLGEDSPLSSSPEKHRVCGPMPPPISYFTAHQGGDVWYIVWLNTDSLGISPEGITLHIS